MTDHKPSGGPGFSDEQREELKKSLLDIVGEDEASRQLAENYFRLVLEKALSHADRGVGLMALAEAGNEGLVMAIREFKSNQGIDFSDHAKFWIRQQILRSLVRYQEKNLN